MSIVLLSLALATLLAAQAIYYGVLYYGQRQQQELKRRLRSLTRAGGGGLLRERRLARSPALSRMVVQLPFADDLEKLILQTDLEWTVASVYAGGLFLGFGFAIGLGFLLRGAALLGLIGVPLGFAVPIVILLGARSRRNAKLTEQLPDALDMMIRSLRAGHGVSAGFKLVATESSLPVAMEFGRCFEEQQAGSSLREAVRNMTRRVPNNLDLKIFATSIVIQHETGGNLVEILEKISYTIRERYKFYGKLRALTTEAKLSGYILGALPFVSGLCVALLNPGYLRPLVDDPFGIGIAVGGLILWGLGGLWMRRLARVDY